MPFFEEELRKIMQYSCYNDRIIFFTSMCYVKVGDYIRMRMELEGDGGYHYNGIKMTMVNYREAEVDNYTLWFLDALGVKKTDAPLFRGGLAPHIWNEGSSWEWYIYKPKPEDYQKLAKVIDSYAILFQEPTVGQESSLINSM